MIPATKLEARGLRVVSRWPLQKIPVKKQIQPHINAGHQSEPSQSVAEETQQLLKYSPLPQEAPAV